MKWVESRRENFQCTIHGRGHVDYFELAAKRDGTMLGLKLKLIQDLGAYHQLLTPAIPTLSVLMMPGLYRFKNISADIVGVFTNCVPTDAYRGAGRPEATHGIERMVDILAAELKMDPVELRLKNFVGNDEFPFPTATGLSYDSGNYEAPLHKALEQVDYTELRKQQAEARAAGKLMGIGISTYGEICAMGPSIALPAGGWESATVKIEPTGKVTVLTGASPHGQGEETTFAQIAADELGVRYRRRAGDARRHGRRAVRHRHLRQPRHRGRRHGAVLRAAGPEGEDEEVRRDAARIPKTSRLPAAPASTRQRQIRLFRARWPSPRITPRRCRPTREPGLVATHFWEPPNFTFPFGAHIVVTEVDRETGDIEIKRYVAVDDCGKIINPLIVDGQVHGGVAQGLGQALWEEAVYDDNGQLVTGELTDYAIPRAHVHAVHREQPHGDAVAGESARSERRRRGRDHRLLARGGQLGGGRALAARRAPHRYAAHPAEDLEADPKRRPGMIPQDTRVAASRSTMSCATAFLASGRSRTATSSI